MSHKDAVSESYDRAYDRKGPLFGLRPDPALAALVTERALSGIALDIGAGDGRHSVLLARRGFSVEAIDLSETGIAHITELARRAHLSITARVADVSAPDAFVGPYDLIVADTVLGHFSQSEVPKIGARIAEALAPGGWLFVTAFADDDPLESEFADPGGTYFSRDSLVAVFSSLRVESCEKLTPVDHTHGEAHRHSVLRLIAYKEDI